MIWLSSLDKEVGERIGVSNWRTLSQVRIDQFAHATEDTQFIHVDPARALREAPFGGTIAHGFLTLSFISALASDVIEISTAIQSVIIVAIDRVKFISPVRSGKQVRGVFTLERQHQVAKDRLLLKTNVVVEIDGETKPALTCDISWIVTFHEPIVLPENAAYPVQIMRGQQAV